MTLANILLILALACFVLKTIGVAPSPKFDVFALGFVFWVLSILLPMVLK